MELVEFRVCKFRSVIDSGWIKADRLTVLVGKNQAGKTGLLKALHKFNPFEPEPYNMDREWPRGRRNERDPKTIVVETRFLLSPAEVQQLQAIAGADIPNQVEIARRYDGTRRFIFPEFDLKEKLSSAFEQSRASLDELVRSKCSVEAKGDMEPVLALLRQHASAGDFKSAKAVIDDALAKITAETPTIRSADAAERKLMRDALTKCAKAIPAKIPTPAIEQKIESWIPTFVYMDDYLTYSGSTFLNQMKERVDANTPTPEDKTIQTLLKMAGLSLDDQVTRAAANDREQRMLDLNDASISLTSEMSGRWSQEDYQVQFQADQFHFMTFVKKPGQTALVPLEEESRGFQWFFSFDLHFAHESKGTLRGAILLLDEPGLHLHPTAQEDLLRRLEAYAKDNQVIFTTHLPFMIDLSRPERIKIVDARPTGSVVIEDIFESSDEDARFTLQAALGMSASQSLLIARYNLVVEGVDDYWFIMAMNEVLRNVGRISFDDRLKITPSFSASKAAYMAAFMCGQDLDVVTFFDSDDEGDLAVELLVKRWMTKYKDREIGIVRVASCLSAPPANATIEDLIGTSLYVECVNEAFKKDLSGTPLQLEPNDTRRVLDRVEGALGRVGISKFNKGTPAKILYKKLRTTKAADLPTETLTAFEKLFTLLNAQVAKFDARTAIRPSSKADDAQIKEIKPAPQAVEAHQAAKAVAS